MDYFGKISLLTEKEKLLLKEAQEYSPPPQEEFETLETISELPIEDKMFEMYVDRMGSVSQDEFQRLFNLSSDDSYFELVNNVQERMGEINEALTGVNSIYHDENARQSLNYLLQYFQSDSQKISVMQEIKGEMGVPS